MRYYKAEVKGELKEIVENIFEQRKKAKEFLVNIKNEFAADDVLATSDRIVAFHFPLSPIKNWKEVKHGYMPTKRTKLGREMLEKISQFPSVDYSRLWEFIEWHGPYFSPGGEVHFNPGTRIQEDVVYLRTEEKEEWVTPSFLIPITYEEFNNA